MPPPHDIWLVRTKGGLLRPSYVFAGPNAETKEEDWESRSGETGSGAWHQRPTA